MKAKIVFLFLILTVSLESIFQTSAFAQRPADKFLRRVYHFGQDSINYRLFVPEVSKSSNRYPLILTLNGDGQRGNNNESQITDNRIAETWAEDSAQQQNPAFIFSPQVPIVTNGSQYIYNREIFIPTINDILDSIIIEFPIDTSRLYITGLSMGCFMTWSIIYSYQLDRYAAAIPMSGQWVLEVAPQITHIPFWAFHGDNDNTVLVKDERDLILAIQNAGVEVVTIHSRLGDIGLTNDQLDSLSSIGVNHIYTEYTGAGHDIWSQSYDDPILHRWLFSQRKETGAVKVELKTSTAIPLSSNLYDNYPNPFNPSTSISFSLGTRSSTSLRVYDVLGREVATIFSGELSAGSYTMQWHAENISSGVYFYRLQSGSFSETKKLLLLK